MMDLKVLRSALEQLKEERGLPPEKVIGAIEDALVAAYKKDYGKKSQIVRARFDLETGATRFEQIKVVADDSNVRFASEADDDKPAEIEPQSSETPATVLPYFNEEQHIKLEDARRIKNDAKVGDELVFPLETKDDYGRIAAQTAKQVIIQRLREAEKGSILTEYAEREGEIVYGKVQKIERGNVFVDLGRATALLPYDEQIPGEHYRQGERVKAYLFKVEETPRSVNLRLSRAHPQFVKQLFAMEAPEVAHGTVEIRAIAREAGSRTKLAVAATDRNIDPVGACVGQRGVRVNTVTGELGGEKIDIIEWRENPEEFIKNALAPAKVEKITLDHELNQARVEVPADQFSMAVGKGGQNVRLAARLTGWKIDIVSPEIKEPTAEEKPVVE